MRIAVAGGTGRIGRLVVAELEREGHEAVSLSRSEGVDLLTGVGLRQRLEGADAVIDTTNPPVADIAEAEHAFATITRNLLTAETEAGVGHHVALSIAALDAVAGNDHYYGKRAQEREVVTGAVPFTIVRATQFHDFPAMIAEWTVVDGEAIVPPLLMQPIAPVDVAAVLVATAVEAPRSSSFDVAGAADGGRRRHGAADPRRSRPGAPAARRLARCRARRRVRRRGAHPRGGNPPGADVLRRLARRRSAVTDGT